MRREMLSMTVALRATVGAARDRWPFGPTVPLCPPRGETVAQRPQRLHSMIGLLLVFFCLGSGSYSSQAQELFEGDEALPPILDQIYTRGLQYLVRTQTPEGHWPDTPYGREPAVVGLAVLSMLAHGEDPNLGPYSESIHRGLNYILEQMNEKTGYIGRSMYNHGFSTLALAEAYGMVENPNLGPALEKAVRLILDAQKRNPLDAWRYSPESVDADTTVTGAQVVALYAARNAGISVPEGALQRGLKFLLSCQGPDGGVGYTSSGAPNGARTAILCTCLALAKQKDAATFKSAFKFLQNAPVEGHYQQYYLYYAAQAYFHADPQAWRNWNMNNIQQLARSQNEDGSWGGQFGETFGTSASLLSLALNYRFLPIYER